MVRPSMACCKADQCSTGPVDWPIILYTSPHMALAPNPVNHWREESLSAAQALLYTFVPHVKPEDSTGKAGKAVDEKTSNNTHSIHAVCFSKHLFLSLWYYGRITGSHHEQNIAELGEEQLSKENTSADRTSNQKKIQIVAVFWTFLGVSVSRENWLTIDCHSRVQCFGSVAGIELRKESHRNSSRQILHTVPLKKTKNPLNP